MQYNLDVQIYKASIYRFNFHTSAYTVTSTIIIKIYIPNKNNLHFCDSLQLLLKSTFTYITHFTFKDVLLSN